MKKFYLSLLTALLFSLPVIANNVIVKGQVIFSNGSPAVNKAVYIQTDSTSTSTACMQGQLVYTNASGYYADTLYCNAGNIVKVRIMVENCDGSYLVESPQVPPANLVERNFTLCTPGGSCHANFNFVVQQLAVSFASTSTAAPGSTITGYAWNFGDGTTGTGANTQRNYTAAGTYTVKLVIESSNTCRDTITKTITVFPVSGTCHAQFRDSAVTGNKFIFLSGGSTVASGDSIIARIWSYGDGTGNSGNFVNTDHIYQVSGTYTVCLKIVSARGCVDSTCKTITAVAPASTCISNFSFQVSGKTAAFNSSASTGATPADSIVSRLWTFGDGSQLSGNVVAPSHTYAINGGFQVCLKITTATGCQKTECKMVYITDSSCRASYTYTVSGGGEVHFTNTSSTAGTSAQYYWTFGNLASSSVANPVYTFPAGTYNVCLRVYSATGCRDSVCKSITIAPPAPNCQAQFTYENLPFTTPPNRSVRFNSSTSVAGAGDSIIMRKWTFGDGASLSGNVVDPVHGYNMPGTYTVCLTIKTKLGCEKSECKLIVVTQSTSACVPHFTWQRSGPKQISFNSSMSWVPVNDTIVERKWNFGDGTSLLTGNVVSPVHNYGFHGIYTVSLRIITARRCEQTVIIPVIVQDSTVAPPTAEPIKIISIFPNPAQAQTQTVVWSLHNNVQAELAIYDVYGTKKWSTTKYLLTGNNMTVLPTAFLLPGPYYFRVTTVYGVKTRVFFKR